MKKPLRVTLVPAHSLVQQGTTGTASSFGMHHLFPNNKSMLLIKSHAPKYQFLDTEQGQPYMASFKKQAEKQAKRAAYNNRLRKQAGKKQATADKPLILIKSDTSDLENLSPAQHRLVRRTLRLNATTSLLKP